MKVEVFTVQDYSYNECSNLNCLRLPENITKIFIRNTVYRIKKGTIAARIDNKFYCNGCIDELYQLCKTKLNRKLWAFQ